MRGKFKPVMNSNMARLNHVKELFVNHPDVSLGSTIYLAEITMSELANEGEIETADFYLASTSYPNSVFMC